MRPMLIVCSIVWLAIAIAWATRGDWFEVLDAAAKATLGFGWAGAIRR